MGTSNQREKGPQRPDTTTGGARANHGNGTRDDPRATFRVQTRISAGSRCAPEAKDSCGAPSGQTARENTPTPNMGGTKQHHKKTPRDNEGITRREFIDTPAVSRHIPTRRHEEGHSRWEAAPGSGKGAALTRSDHQTRLTPMDGHDRTSATAAGES